MPSPCQPPITEAVVNASDYQPLLAGYIPIEKRPRFNMYDQWDEFLSVRRDPIPTLAVCAFEPLAEPPDAWFDEDGDIVEHRTFDGVHLYPPAFFNGKPVSHVDSFVCGPLGISADGAEIQIEGVDDRELSAALGHLEWKRSRTTLGGIRRALMQQARNSILPESLIGAYLQTRYEVVSGASHCELRVGQANPDLTRLYEASGARSSAFITAWNPEGSELDGQDNDRRNALLKADLMSLTNQILEGQGVGSDEAWIPEASFLSLGPSFEQAVHLGRHYEQNAIIWAAEDAIPRLVLLR